MKRLFVLLSVLCLLLSACSKPVSGGDTEPANQTGDSVLGSSSQTATREYDAHGLRCRVPDSFSLYETGENHAVYAPTDRKDDWSIVISYTPFENGEEKLSDPSVQEKLLAKLEEDVDGFVPQTEELRTDLQGVSHYYVSGSGKKKGSNQEVKFEQAYFNSEGGITCITMIQGKAKDFDHSTDFSQMMNQVEDKYGEVPPAIPDEQGAPGEPVTQPLVPEE